MDVPSRHFRSCHFAKHEFRLPSQTQTHKLFFIALALFRWLLTRNAELSGDHRDVLDAGSAGGA